MNDATVTPANDLLDWLRECFDAAVERKNWCEAYRLHGLVLEGHA